MRRLYRESHYANGTIESGEGEPVFYQRAGRTERRTRTGRDGSREEGRKKARLRRGGRGEERITHNLTEGRGADPAKKAAAQLFLLDPHRTLGGPLSAAPTLSVLLFAMLILAQKP